MKLISTGYGEIAAMKKLNEIWGDDGCCIRLQQHIGPTVLSDLIFSSWTMDETYSIEVKKITEKRKGTGDLSFILPRPLSFTYDFSISVAKYEPIPHQLERQVILCRRMGWRPVLLLNVVHPEGWPTRYLFDSEKLYRYWKDGHVTISPDKFPEFHDYELANRLTKGDNKWIKTTMSLPSKKQSRK